MTSSSNSTAIWDASECALLLIDYQPEVMSFIRSGDPRLVELNARYLTKAALAFHIPIVLSTIGVGTKVNKPTIPSIRTLIPDVAEIDRTSMDSWADENFRKAVEKAGRKKLVMCGIVTEICLAYPVVAALNDGFEVSFVADAVGGNSKEAHDIAILRMIQAGAVPNTATAMICEWFRDWAGPLGAAAQEILPASLNEIDLLADRNPRMEVYGHQ